jgi:hypothetical protein
MRTLPHRAASHLWHSSLAIHTLVYALILVALVPFARLDAPFISDEGAYGLQVRSLEAGSWEYPYPGEAYDPEGRYFPITHSTRSDRGWFTYIRHPLYPVLLWVSVKIIGERFGFHVFSLTGAVVVAVAAWLLAGELDRRASRLAFWIAALGPALVNGFIMWAHTLSAAVSGLAGVVALRVLRRGHAGPVAVTLVWGLLVLGGLVRSEGLLFAGVLAIVFGTYSLRSGRSAERRVAAAALMAVTCAAGVDAMWRRMIAGVPVPEFDRASWTVRDRLSSFRVGLVGASYFDYRAGALSVLAIVAVSVGVWAERRSLPRAHSGLFWGTAVASGLWLARVILAPGDPMFGLVTAWPVVLCGVGLPCRRIVNGAFRALLLVTVMFASAVLGAQYSLGGGFEWGARFLSPAQAPIAALVAVAVFTYVSKNGYRWGFGPAFAALLVIPAVLGMVVLRTTRDRASERISQVTKAGSSVIVTAHPHLARAAWRNQRVAWLLGDNTNDLKDVLSRLNQFAVTSVTVYTPFRLSDLSAVSREYSFDFQIVAGSHREGEVWRVVVLRSAG